MKLALAIWEGRISPVFDVSRELLLCEVERGVVTRRRELLVDGEGAARASRLVELGVETLVCGAISSSLACLVEASRIRLVPFVAGEVDEVLRAYLAGELPDPDLTMPGCRGRRRRRRVSWQPRERTTGEPAGASAPGPQLEDSTMPRGDGTGPDGRGRNGRRR